MTLRSMQDIMGQKAFRKAIRCLPWNRIPERRGMRAGISAC